MAIARSIETRLREAVVRDLKADTDIFAYCGGTGTPSSPTKTARIYNGPLAIEDVSMSTPQINVANMPDQEFELGVSGATVSTKPIVIVLSERHLNSPFATGGTTPIDVLVHIEALLEAGGADANDQGRLVDPDASVGATGVAKYINTNLVRLVRPFPRLNPKAAIVHWVTVAYFETREDINRERV